MARYQTTLENFRLADHHYSELLRNRRYSEAAKRVRGSTMRDFLEADTAVRNIHHIPPSMVTRLHNVTVERYWLPAVP